MAELQQFDSLTQQMNVDAYKANQERTFSDKVLAREEVGKIEALIRKPVLTKEDWSVLLFLLAGVESKLLNFEDYDRYLLGKFYAWIRDFVTLQIKFYEYKEYITKEKEKGRKLVSDKSTKLLDNMISTNGESTKYLADVFFYLGRSTLSLSGSGFQTLTTNKFEYAYPSVANMPVQNMQQQNKGFFGWGNKS